MRFLTENFWGQYLTLLCVLAIVILGGAGILNEVWA